MTESKIDLTERLRREGRWSEASKFKDAKLAEFRANGMKRTEAAEAAWTAMADAYPPLAGAAPVARTPEATSTDAPPIPWSDLPTEANFDDEVVWVHQQYILIVEETPRGRIIHWDRATIRPPSTGACSLAQWAAENRTAFYKDLLPKTMARSDGPRATDENTVEAQDPGLKDVKAMLKQLEDDADAELRANVPVVLQGRVRKMLTNWVEKHEVPLESDARVQLDSDICRLIEGSLRAFTSARV
jgi:hypothetical protein